VKLKASSNHAADFQESRHKMVILMMMIMYQKYSKKLLV